MKSTGTFRCLLEINTALFRNSKIVRTTFGDYGHGAERRQVNIPLTSCGVFNIWWKALSFRFVRESVLREHSKMKASRLRSVLVAVSGGLGAYGPEQNSVTERVAILVAKVLAGANPAELPIERPTRYELVVNIKAAKALGLTIPDAILARADRSIR
jgi:hypothetical protein